MTEEDTVILTSDETERLARELHTGLRLALSFVER